VKGEAITQKSFGRKWVKNYENIYMVELEKQQDEDLFLANNRLKSILKKGTMTQVTTIITDHISGQQSFHYY